MEIVIKRQMKLSTGVNMNYYNNLAVFVTKAPLGSHSEAERLAQSVTQP